MNSREYIIKKIDELYNEFPHLNFKYGIEMPVDDIYHIIEVTPVPDYYSKNGDKFVNKAIMLLMNFIDKYKEEGLLFLDKDTIKDHEFENIIHYKAGISIKSNILNKIPMTFTSEPNILNKIHMKVSSKPNILNKIAPSYDNEEISKIKLVA